MQQTANSLPAKDLRVNLNNRAAFGAEYVKGSMNPGISVGVEARSEQTFSRAFSYVTAPSLASAVTPASPIEGAFPQLAAGMRREGALLHPTPAQLEQSFLDGDAVVAIDKTPDRPHDRRAFGYVRLEPLLTERLMSLLGVTSECPVVMEAGSMFVSSEGHYRGHGHLNQLCNALFETRSTEIASGRLLVIGTTKHLAVLKSLKACETGDFVPCHHLEFPHLAALTCICSGSMGTGFHTSVECPERISANHLIDPDNFAEIPRNGGKIPCTMFVSNRELARQADQAIAGAVSGANNDETIANLVARLKEIGFYAPQVAVTVAGNPL